MSQKGSRKSRLGCLACKYKRIKCDETKPQCVMCTSRYQRCPGYQKPLRWSTKHEAKLDESPRLPPFSEIETFQSWPDLSHCSSSDVVIEQQAWPSQTLESNSLEPSKPLDLDEPRLADFLSTVGMINYGNLVSIGDAGLSELGFDESFLCSGDSQRLEDFLSFDTLPNSDIGFCTTVPSVASPSDYYEVSEDPDQEFFGEIQVRDRSRGRGAGTPPRPDHELTPQVISQTGAQLYLSGASRDLTHIPTLLIDYWFQGVCNTWNSFDSARNLNRDVAIRTFAHSQAVAYSLQSMAAVYLAEHLPHFRDIAISMTQAAVHAIRLDLARRTSPCTLPQELLLSMFCIGTSACWVDSLQFGLPFLKEVKAVLQAYNPLKAHLSANEQKTLESFNVSALYWDMLCNIVGAETSGNLGPTCISPSRLPSFEEQKSLHPWTGASTGIMMLFFEVILLCRRFRVRVTLDPPQTSHSLRAVLDDIGQAKNLHRRVETFPIPTELDILDTEDKLTPKSHLIEIAKSYQSAALLHLRQTFPELAKERMTNDEATTLDTCHHVLGLGLEIIQTLEKIPLTSGTRCIQPLLCLTAGIALKFDISPAKQQHALSSLSNILSADLRSPLVPALCEPYLGQFDSEKSSSSQITWRSIQAARGRRFVLERFGILESTLPPKPIRVAKQLVLAVWAAYDNQSSRNSQVHWIDIMVRSNLQTIFG